MRNFYFKHRQILLYGATMALLLFVLKWLELRFLIMQHAFEFYAGAIALIFTALGIWIAQKIMRPKKETIIIERKILVSEFVFNEAGCAERNISKRELEVLELMAKGYSNAEIADMLFVSLNTVKTHAARLFEKLEAKRRTQAVENAKRLNLLP